MLLLMSADSSKSIKEIYQSVKRFVSRSVPTFCRFFKSGAKLFAKVITLFTVAEVRVVEIEALTTKT